MRLTVAALFAGVSLSSACLEAQLPMGSWSCGGPDDCLGTQRCEVHPIFTEISICVGQCSSLDGPCVEGVLVDGTCTAVPRDDGTACELADDICHTGSCAAGTCGVGTEIVCEDGNDCSEDHCHPVLGCVSVMDGCPCTGNTDCADRDTCDGIEQCVAGVCQGGVAKDCSRPADGCEVGSCDVLDGQCTYQTKVLGTACSDGDGCTLDDRCDDLGACGGDAKVCTSDEPCAPLICVSDDGLGVCHPQPLADDTVCDDGDPCSLGDRCVAQICMPQLQDSAWQVRLGPVPAALVRSDNDGFLVLKSGADAAAVGVDASGATAWTAQLPGTPRGASVVWDNYTVVGDTEQPDGTRHAWMSFMTGAGVPQGTGTYPTGLGGGDERFYDVAWDPWDETMVVGSTTVSGGGGRDAWVVRQNNAGRVNDLMESHGGQWDDAAYAVVHVPGAQANPARWVVAGERTLAPGDVDFWVFRLAVGPGASPLLSSDQVSAHAGGDERAYDVTFVASPRRVVAVGSRQLSGVATRDGYIGCADPDEWDWDFTIQGGEGDDVLWTVVAGAAGEAVAGGSYSQAGREQVWVLRIDAVTCTPIMPQTVVDAGPGVGAAALGIYAGLPGFGAPPTILARRSDGPGGLDDSWLMQLGTWMDLSCANSL